MTLSNTDRIYEDEIMERVWWDSSNYRLNLNFAKLPRIYRQLVHYVQHLQMQQKKYGFIRRCGRPLNLAIFGDVVEVIVEQHNLCNNHCR